MAYSSNNSVFLPGMANQNMDEDNVEMLGITTVTDAVSEMNNGLLEISIPFANAAKPRSLKIN